MYLYFDRNGTLREIINDEALRQGNYGVNKMYVYVDGRNYSSLDVNYLLPAGNIVGNQNYDDFTDPTSEDNSDCFIPFNPKRDLRYFRYGEAYEFCIIDLEANFTDVRGVETYTDGPLSQAGLVHCSIQMILIGGSQLQLGEVNFFVEGNDISNEVAPEQYLSLSNYQFLRKMLEGIQRPSIEIGTTTTGEPGSDAQVINVGTDFNAIFNFTIPQGDQGPQGKGTQITGIAPNGYDPLGGAKYRITVQNDDPYAGTSSTAYLDFTAPKGPKGDTGSDGAVVPLNGLVTLYVDSSTGHLMAISAPGGADPSTYLSIDANGHLIFNP